MALLARLAEDQPAYNDLANAVARFLISGTEQLPPEVEYLRSSLGAVRDRISGLDPTAGLSAQPAAFTSPSTSAGSELAGPADPIPPAADLVPGYLESPDGHADAAGQPGRDICDRCHCPVYLATGTDQGEPWESWQHVAVADDVFCGLVMRAADRLPK
jgi:hypothetical protein